MSPFFYVGLSIICTICGQLGLKRGMGAIGKSGAAGTGIFVKMVTSPWVIGGLAVYFMGVISWILALSSLPLTLAYPFGSLSYVGVFVASYFLFKEKITRARWLGIAIIVAGLVIIGLSSNETPSASGQGSASPTAQAQTGN